MGNFKKKFEKLYASNGASVLVHTTIILKLKGSGRIQDLRLIKDGGFNILICEAVCARVNRLVNTPVPRSYEGYAINNMTPISRCYGHESNITF